MPTEAALIATVAAQDGSQMERLDYDDHESMSSKSAAELAASAAQLRQLMQKLLDSRSPKQQRQQLLHQNQPQLEPLLVPDLYQQQQHQTYQVHADVVFSEHQQQGQLQQGQEHLACFGSSLDLQVAEPAAIAEAPEQTLTQLHAAGTELETQDACDAQQVTAPPAPTEQQAKAHNGLNSLAAHARELLQEIEAAAASSPATTFSSAPSPPPLPQQQRHGSPAEAATRRKLAFTFQQDNATGPSTMPAHQEPCSECAVPKYTAAAVASSLDDSLSWSTALQQYQLHTQQQEQQQQRLQQQPQQQQQKQPQARTADEQHADNWSSSYLANSPSPEGFVGLYPPYAAAEPSAPSLTVAQQGTELQLEPCAAAAAAAASVAARITAFSGLSSAEQSALHATQHCPEAQQQHKYTHGAGMATGGSGSLGFSMPGNSAAAVAPSGSAHGSSVVLGGAVAAGAGAGAAADQLSPGLRLRVRSLRGPLEDAMRCYAELHEVKQEASLLRATNARLTAAAQDADSEKAYLMAERGLLTAQLRNMAALLAAGDVLGSHARSGDAAIATGPTSGGRAKASSSGGGASRAPGFLGMCAGGAFMGAAQASITAEHEAEAQLATAWRLLPANSSLRFTCHPSQLPRDMSAVANEVEAAIDRQQQQVVQLQEQLGQQTAALQQAQQATELLQQRLASAGTAAELTVGQVAAKLEAKWGRRVMKAEQHVAALAQEHQSAVGELQQQLSQAQQALMQSQQAAEQLADDKACLASRLAALESDRAGLLEQLEQQNAAKCAVQDQVASLQQEQQQLLAACSALEGSLLEARQSTEQQRAAVARLEGVVQRKNIAVVEVKQQLRETRQQAQQTCAEMQQLQEQLGALRIKYADTARQLSAARTAAKDAGEALAAVQARAHQQTTLLDELRAELDKARRASATAQKAQAAEAKRAAAAELTVTSLQRELSAAKETADGAAAAADAAKCEQRKAQQQKQQAQKEVKQLQHQVEQLLQNNQRLVQQRQQLQSQLSVYEQLLIDYEQSLAAAARRAESADAELAGVRQEVAEWATLRNSESCELQETRQKLAATATDLGVAIQRVAACGMQTRLSAGSRPNSACAARGLAPGAAAAASSMHASGSLLGQQQLQHLPTGVTRQLQWQAEEVLRLTSQLLHVQAKLRDAEQQLTTCQQELTVTQQQLAAAEDVVRWHQQQQEHQQAQQPRQHQALDLEPQDESSKVQKLQNQVQHLQRELAEANGQVAEQSSALAAAKLELVQQQREHYMEVCKLQEELSAADAAITTARQQMEDQQWKQQVQRQQQSMNRLQQLQQMEDENVPQQVPGRCSSEDSSSDSDSGSGNQDCDKAALDDNADAAAGLALPHQQGGTLLQNQQKQHKQQGKQLLHMARGSKRQAKFLIIPAASVADSLAEAAAACVVNAAEALQQSSSGVVCMRQTSNRAEAAAEHCGTVTCALQLTHTAGNESSSSSRPGQKDSGSSGQGTSSGRPTGQACSPGTVCDVPAEVHLACDCMTPSAQLQLQQRQQQQGEQKREQQLQQQLQHIQLQLLKQQQLQQQVKQPQPQQLQQLSAGGGSAVQDPVSAAVIASRHVIRSGSSAYSTGAHAVSYSASSAAAVPVPMEQSDRSAVGLSSAALLHQQQQQQRYCSSGPSASCEGIAEQTNSHLWEVESSSCDYEGALAAAAAALRAAS